jgi:hypothetical protein
MQLKKRNKKVKSNDTEIVRPTSTPIHVPDLKASFFVADTDDSEKIMVRLDEGRYKGIIIELCDFEFVDDASSTMNFTYDVVYSPTGTIPNDKTFEVIIKKVSKKIIEYAVNKAMEVVDTSNLTHITK